MPTAAASVAVATAEEDRADHDHQQHQRRQQVGKKLHAHLPVGRDLRAAPCGFQMQATSTVRLNSTVEDEARQEAREIELGHRRVGHHAVDDHVDRGRDEDPERAAGRQGAEEQRLVVLVLVDLAHRHDADGGGRRHARARDRAEQRAGADVGMHQPARQPAEPLHQRGIHALGRAGAQQDLAEQDVEGDGGQDEVAGGRPGELADDAAHRHRRVDVVQQHAGQAHAGRDGDRAAEQEQQHQERDAGGHFFFSCSRPCATAAISSSASSERGLRADRVRTGRCSRRRRSDIRPRTSSSRQSATKNTEAREPQALRDHQRRLDRRQRVRVGDPGLADHAPGVEGHHAEEEQQRAEADQVEQGALRGST